MKKVLIAADHAGVELKEKIQRLLPDWEWQDLGPPEGKRVDYPDYAEKLTKSLTAGNGDFGVLICGSGVGMSIAANKVPGIRAALVENPTSARLAREHNDANVLCLGSRFLAPEYAAEISRTFLEAGYSEDERHHQRVEKINEIEKKSSERNRC